MIIDRRRVAGLLSASAVLLAACGGDGQRARTANAVKLPDTCRRVEHFGDPLVIDWTPEQRAQLEAVMRDHVAIVAYDCNALRLLPDCRIDGTYGYVGTTHKEQVLQLDGGDELRANVPAGADALFEQLHGASSEAAPLDVAVATVGRWSTSRATAHRPALQGTCEGATHFVRYAFVGGFAMQPGEKGKAPAATDLFARPSGDVPLRAADGDLAACRASAVDGAEPPGACRSIVRVELTAIDAPVASATELQSAKCPKGMVRAQNKCTLPVPYLDYECAFDDGPTCAQECKKGNAVSCGRLGWAYASGYSLAKDDRRAYELLTQSCQAGYEDACLSLGTMYVKGTAGPGLDADKARRLFEQSCHAGVGRGCHNLGIVYREGVGVPKDPDKALTLFLRSCDEGHAPGCSAAGDLVPPKDKARAVSLFRRGCIGDHVEGCKALERLGAK